MLKSYLLMMEVLIISANLIKKFLFKIKNKKINQLLISYKKNMGKGYAVIQGIRKSTHPWILHVYSLIFY